MIHTYTIVLHSLKSHFGLTDNDYYVIDTIDILSPNEKWCYKSKANIAGDLHITERTVNSSIKKLVQLGLVQKRENNSKYLRPTNLWKSKKEEFKKLIGNNQENIDQVVEEDNQLVGNDKAKTTKVFPEKPKTFRTRKQEQQIENIEKNRILDQFLNF